MMEHDLLVSPKDPQSFLKLLHTVALTSSLLILCLSGVAIYLLYQAYAISSAEAEAIEVSESILALERERLLGTVAGRSDQLRFDESEIARLDSTLSRFLAPHGIIKIKIFSPQGRILYSTDASIIGHSDPSNARLAIALSGQSDSTLQTKERVQDLMNEQHFDVDVVETYVPIRNDQGEVVGSFEIYQDITKHRHALATSVAVSMVIFAVILFCVFSIAYLILRMAVRQLARTQEELRLLATFDSLTGLLNRREIIRSGESEFSLYQRRQKEGESWPFSLIMADLDKFKQLNDRFGHPQGDEALRRVAALLSSQMRRYSKVGRYGGEEFLVLLPQAASEEAEAVAERIRQAVAAEPLLLGGEEVKLTLSLGVATVMINDQDFDAVMVRADQALYRAKEAGRDRVVTDC